MAGGPLYYLAHLRTQAAAAGANIYDLFAVINHIGGCGGGQASFADCTNTPGSWNCSCNAGFDGAGSSGAAYSNNRDDSCFF